MIPPWQSWAWGRFGTETPLSVRVHTKVITVDFFQERPDRGLMQQRCTYIEQAAHTRMLASRRQHITTTERQAQVGVLRAWLRELDEQRAAAPPAPSPRAMA